jgi:hypothetical protein
MPSIQLPARPPTPRAQSSLPATDSTTTSTWTEDVPRSAAPQTTSTTGRVLDSRSQVSWPGSPASYSPAPTGGRAPPPVAPPIAGGPLPPFHGSWTRQ